MHIDEKSLADTLSIEPEKVDKIMISDLESVGEYKSTTDPDKIHQFINYLNQLSYTRLPADQTAYMPRKATIIYLYDQDKQDFIVSYETEAMIDHKVYEINHGKIENSFLSDYYKSLD